MDVKSLISFSGSSHLFTLYRIHLAIAKSNGRGGKIGELGRSWWLASWGSMRLRGGEGAIAVVVQEEIRIDKLWQYLRQDLQGTEVRVELPYSARSTICRADKLNCGKAGETIGVSSVKGFIWYSPSTQ